MGLRVMEREVLLLDEREEGEKLNRDCTMCRSRGRRVGRQPDIMPMEGSTEDQMETSLLARLMSVVRRRRVEVIMRYLDAKHTLL